MHYGSSTISTTSNPLRLNNVLHVPQMTTNLLSVNQFCKDNNCYFIFTDLGFCVKDNLTRRTLLQGQNKDRLYPLQISRSQGNFPFTSTTLLSNRVGSSIWHHRLGHPANHIFHLMLNKNNLPLLGTPHLPSICVSCQIGKSKRLPFNSSA